MSTKVAIAFTERIQKSGLVSSEKLSQLQQELEAEGVDVDDPTAISKALVARNELSQWQADKLLQGKHKGFFLGSYRLEKPLGKGGMGAVFLARHVVMRRQCAIKVLPQTQIKKHSSVLDRFILESQAVASLDHQNIVRPYDIAKESKDNKEIHYLVMEYVEGQDAQQTVQEHGVLSYVKAAEIIRQTANGLVHAHENGLVHRDIKPANILMDRKGIVKILDLGLARFFDDDEAASLTAAHNETVLGTADYLSPEQALNSHDVDLRTDIYSLGCTAFFLLTGHPPFPEGTVAQRLVAHQVKQPEPITNERPDAPPELLAIIDKMMAKKPEDRFQDCGEISTVLAAWLIKFGGEDWRRQHSEITADSAILKLLTTHREPTRAMASPMDETSLELVMEDDDEDDRATTASGSSAGSGSGVVSGAGGSSNLLGDELGMADDHDDRSVAEVEPQQLPTFDAEDDGEPVGAIDELPTLDHRSTSDSSHDGLFGELPLEGGLDALDLVDQTAPLDTVDSSPGLGALESDIRKMPVGSPSSSTRQKKVVPETPKTLWQSITSVGLPIVVGVVGGGILVVVMLLVYFFTGAKEPDRTDVSTGTTGGADAVSMIDTPTTQPEQGPDTIGSPTQDEPETPDERSQGPTASQDALPNQKGAPRQDGPSRPSGKGGRNVAQVNSGTGGTGRAQQPKPADYQQRPAAQPRPGPTDPVQPTTSGADRPPVDDVVDTPGRQPTPPTTPDTPPDSTGNSTDDVEDGEMPEVAQAPVVPEVSATQLFAATKEFALNMKMASGGGQNKKAATNSDGLARMLRPGLQHALEYAVRSSDLVLVDRSETAQLTVTIAGGMVDGFNLVVLTASLDCRHGDAEPISVWSLPQTEAVKFKPGTSNRLVLQMWEDKMRDIFRGLRDDHKKAVQDAGR